MTNGMSISEAAKIMSKLGSSKGGKAKLTTMSPEERSEIARNASIARWAKVKNEKQKAIVKVEAKTNPEETMLFSMFRGTLAIGDTEMECHVLNNGQRVFTQTEIVRILTAGVQSGNLSRYLDANPLIDNSLNSGQTINFKVDGGAAIGREATTLIEICEKYLEAKEQKLLKPRQLKLAKQAGIIIRSCAKIGIVALVDEATGYQQFRQKKALQIKLQAFIADEMQEWAMAFPPEFWFQLARLEGIKYSSRNRPIRWGKYIMAFVYDAIDGDVGRQLREKNPHPAWGRNHHQWLKDFGKDALNRQITSVITIMKLCNNMDDFRQKFAQVFQKTEFEDTNWADSSPQLDN